ncbi:MAG: MgtC/SapB family protein [Pirellulales bacterium]|nr:MgtC/SapB family protein [Pirellulales bacterium]
MEQTFQQLGVALLLGLLVGLEREHSAGGIAGMRTFPLITVLGTLCALLAKAFGGWILGAGMLGVVAVLGLGYLRRLQEEKRQHLGITTEAAMLVMYAVGALVVVYGKLLAVTVGGGVAVLLQFKPELHGFAKRLGDSDLRAIMRFVILSCIILPLLPDQNYGFSRWGLPPELDVFNPRWTWLMVVLIVGMSLGGYIVYKFFGRNAGVLLGGVLGGAISSTAATVSYARQAKTAALDGRSAATVIMIASAVSLVRVTAAITVVAPEFSRSAALPLMLLMGATLLPAAAVWFRDRGRSAPMPDQENPTQLKSALVFGLLYALVLFALAGARLYFDQGGLYVVAGLSGLTEMDAITLSTARMAVEDPGMLRIGWRLIVTAVMANMVSKTALAGLLGGRRLLGILLMLFLPAWIGGAVLLALF